MQIAKKETKAKLSDFDRFKVLVIKKKANKIIGKEVAALKKAAAKK